MARIQTVAGWLVSIPASLIFLVAGGTKFTSPNWEARFAGWGYPDWFRVVVGTVEVVCAVALLVPRVRTWAAVVLAMVMLGAAGTHLAHGETPRIVTNAMLAVPLIAVALLRPRG